MRYYLLLLRRQHSQQRTFTCNNRLQVGVFNMLIWMKVRQMYQEIIAKKQTNKQTNNNTVMFFKFFLSSGVESSSSSFFLFFSLDFFSQKTKRIIILSLSFAIESIPLSLSFSFTNYNVYTPTYQTAKRFTKTTRTVSISDAQRRDSYARSDHGERKVSLRRVFTNKTFRANNLELIDRPHQESNPYFFSSR